MQRFDLTEFLKNALAEDIGSGDITSLAVVPEDAVAKFVIVPRQEIVLAGAAFLPELMQLVDPRIQLSLHAKDGDFLKAHQIIGTLEGPARSLLTVERTALNLLQHLSGVATLTRQYVEAVKGTNAKITDTRKTIPGLRYLQKYAVRMGGGHNHRLGLYDAVLIKDNHLTLAGGIAGAVAAARAQASHGMIIELECDTPEQVEEALTAKPDIVLLDNMDIGALKACVERLHTHGIQTEASGNVTLHTIRAIAETGVEAISIGRLTHSAPAVDIGLDALK